MLLTGSERRLAPEMWLTITSLLDPGDIDSLARTSKYLYLITRTQLYREVDLSNPKRHISHSEREGLLQFDMPLDTRSCFDTLRLLATDPALARYVQAIKLPKYTGMSLSECQQMNRTLKDAIRNLKSLRKLKFSCIPPFSHDQDPEGDVKARLDFVYILSTVKYNLRELRIDSWARSDYRFSAEDQTRFQNLNLTRLVCEERLYDKPVPGVTPYGKINVSVSIASVSCNTLKHLCIGIELGYYMDDCAFWKLRFPSLQTLRLGKTDWDFLDEPEFSSTKFFLAHASTLRWLRVEYIADIADAEVTFINVDGELMMRYLSVDGDSIREIMDNYRDEATPEMTYFHLYPHEGERERDFRSQTPGYERMVRTTSTEYGNEPPLFPKLEHFAITIDFSIEEASNNMNPPIAADEPPEFDTPEDNLNNVCDWILYILGHISCIPGDRLREFTFSSPWFPVSAASLAEVFHCYPTLEKITMNKILIESDSSAEEYAVELAKECPFLQEVVFMPSPRAWDLTPDLISPQMVFRVLHVPIRRDGPEEGVPVAGERFYTEESEILGLGLRRKSGSDLCDSEEE